MAISEYQKNGKIFYKVYVQCRGKRLKQIRLQKLVRDIDSLASARREERRLLQELARQVEKLEGKGLLWSEVLFRWETAAYSGHLGKKINSFTVKDHMSRMKKYSSPWLDLIASDLNKADGRRVLAFAESLGAKQSLLNKIKSTINLIYNWGVEEGLITGSNLSGKSPVFGLGIDDKEEKIKPILTLDEVRKFLLEAKIQKHPWYPIWAFAILTGMRSGELMALEWGDIDEKNGIIRVSKSFNKRLQSTKCPKNGTWRNVDINSQLREIICDLGRSRINERFVLPNFPEWKNGNAGEVLRLFLKRIGIHKDVVFHTLRACFATHLLSTGVEPLKVMRMGGWSDLKTFQIYLRMSGVDVKGVAEGLDVLPDKSQTDNVIPLYL
jgi:integrase